MRQRKRIFYCTLLFIGLAVTLEIVSRHLAHLIPIEIQQKYSGSGQNSSRYQVNGRGARGRWPHQRKLSVALFGSSIAAMNGLPEEETWTRLLETHAPFPLHIDNFAAGFAKASMLTEVFEKMAQRDVKYDAVIIQLVPDILMYSRKQTFSMTYHARWMHSKSTLCAFCDLAQSFVMRRVPNESQFWTGWSRLFPPNAPEARLVIYDRKRYQEMRKVGSFSDKPIGQESGIMEYSRGHLERMFAAAKKISSTVIWMPENIAYHHEMLPEYLNRYITLWRTSENENSNEYHSPLSFSALFNKMNLLAFPIAQSQEVAIIDWISPLVEALPTQSGLFVDEYHLSTAGSRRVFQIVEKPLYEILQAKIRTENR